MERVGSFNTKKLGYKELTSSNWSWAWLHEDLGESLMLSSQRLFSFRHVLSELAFQEFFHYLWRAKERSFSWLGFLKRED